MRGASTRNGHGCRFIVAAGGCAVEMERLESRTLLALAVADYYPLDADMSWGFDGARNGLSVHASMGNTLPNSGPGMLQSMSYSGAGGGQWEGLVLSNDWSGLKVLGRLWSYGSYGLGETADGGGIRLLPAQVNVGATYGYAGSLTGHTQNWVLTETISGWMTIVGEETVTTPAGTFRALRVDRSGNEEVIVHTAWGPALFLSSTTTESQWLVRGLGLVGLDRAQTGTDSNHQPFSDAVSVRLTSSSELDANRGFWLKGKGLTIEQGDDSQTVADGTNYGGIDVAGATKTRVFVIGNSGVGNLTIGSIVIGGANAGEFTLVRIPATTLAPGQSTPFSVRFDPSGTGFRYATVSVYSSDLLANPFVFTVRGNGLAFGVIRVQRADKLAPVVNGATTGTLATGTSIGRTTAAGTGGAAFIERTFVITNVGLGTLNLTGTPRVRIEGSGSAGFTIVGPGVTTLAPGASTTFVVHFDPVAVGGYFATVFIPNSDHWTPVFGFAIVGTGK